MKIKYFERWVRREEGRGAEGLRAWASILSLSLTIYECLTSVWLLHSSLKGSAVRFTNVRLDKPVKTCLLLYNFISGLLARYGTLLFPCPCS